MYRTQQKELTSFLQCMCGERQLDKGKELMDEQKMSETIERFADRTCRLYLVWRRVGKVAGKGREDKRKETKN